MLNPCLVVENSSPLSGIWVLYPVNPYSPQSHVQARLGSAQGFHQRPGWAQQGQTHHGRSLEPTEMEERIVDI